MSAERITAPARSFLAEYISSVAQLDLLLLLRTNPQRAWSVDDLVRELRIEPSWAEPQLQNLVDHGLVEQTDNPQTAFRYAPRTPEQEDAATTVAQAYLVNRVSVIEFIYSRPNQNIQAFADAFRLRKENPRG